MKAAFDLPKIFQFYCVPVSIVVTESAQGPVTVQGTLHIFLSLVPGCLFVTPWIVAHQAPQSMGFPRQEYWSGLPFPPPGDLPDPEIESASPVSAVWQTDSLPTEPLGKQ